MNIARETIRMELLGTAKTTEVAVGREECGVGKGQRRGKEEKTQTKAERLDMKGNRLKHSHMVF